MDTPRQPMPSPASSPSSGGGRFKSGLAVLGVLGGLGAYWYVFPDGPLNAFVGVEPSTGTSACLALIKSPVCYVFGWSSAGDETPPYSVEERKARIRLLAAGYGITNEITLSGGPSESDESDRAGYLHWLGHAPEADFAKVLDALDAELAMQAFSPDRAAKKAVP